MGIFKGTRDEVLFCNDTIIEHGMVLDASLLSGSCGIIIRGIVRSNIDIDADVCVDSSGTVEGDIVCSNCTVKGRVEGNISATGKLVITEDGTVFGDILCVTLEISQGGNFKGTCNKSKKISPDKKITLFDIYVQKDPQIHMSDSDCHIGSAEGANFKEACQKLSLVNPEFAEGFNVQTLTFYGRPLFENPEPGALGKTV